MRQYLYHGYLLELAWNMFKILKLSYDSLFLICGLLIIVKLNSNLVVINLISKYIISTYVCSVRYLI